jgi:hypothetical protein
MKKDELEKASYLEKLKQIAEANGGKLLSSEWKGSSAKYRFAFADGREFETRAGRIGQISQGWPKDPDAYFRNYSENRGAIHLNDMSRIAEANGGRLLSTEWIGDAAKYNFSFADGRDFYMAIGSLRKGWPKDPDAYFRTYGDSRESIHFDGIRRIAQANGGKLLSSEWKGSQAKYRLAFSDGREFEMVPGKIRKGWPKDPDLYFRSFGESRCELLLMDLRSIAQANGGRLLSTVWQGSQAKYRFLFADGREFFMKSNNMKTQGWPKDPDRYLSRQFLSLD